MYRRFICFPVEAEGGRRSVSTFEIEDEAIYVVARLSGEGNDRLPDKGDFQLTDSEVRDILALDRAYDRFMLIVNAGGPVDLTPVAGVGNILVASQLGVEMGAAVADVLLGISYPSGKLATTWAACDDYCQLGDFAQPDDTRYREGIFVGYRYFDATSWSARSSGSSGRSISRKSTCGPALNVHRNVLCGRNFEYYSEDPLVSGPFAAVLTRGVQAHPGRGVTVKHFAANNQETNRYANNSIVSERALREIYLKGFGICMREAAPRALMTSYNLVNGTHTSESLGLARILRHEFGFGGVVMTDWVVGGDLLTSGAKYPGPDPAKVAAAGCSLFMPGSKKDHEALLAGLAGGTVTREQLERNAAYLLRTLWEMRICQGLKP